MSIFLELSWNLLIGDRGSTPPFYLFSDALPEMQINGGSDEKAVLVLKMRMKKLYSIHAQRGYKGGGRNRYYPRPDNARCNAPFYA